MNRAHKNLIGLGVFAFTFFLLPFSLPRQALAALTVDDLVQAEKNNFASHSYVVMDQVTGEVLMQKNATDVWVPASLTKMVTALVVLDLAPDMNKRCTVTQEHEVGGARLAATNNAVYKLGDLLHASLVASANNATDALADCVLPRADFVARMNQKAVELGAKNTSFLEPSGMDIGNRTTAEDIAMIARAAFSTLKIQQVTQKKSVSFSSISTPKKYHTLKSTNLLLSQKGVSVVGAKTGYLDEALYNFALSSKVGSRYLITVVLGNPTKNGSFEETKKLAQLASGAVATIGNLFVVATR